MPGPHRWLLVLSVALLMAAAGGIVAQDRSGSTPAMRTSASVPPPSGPTAPSAPGATTTSTTTSTTMVAAPTVPPGPVAGSAALAAGMIDPTDMGGYYRINASVAASVLHSAPCLAGLTSSTSDVGRADTALLGPDYHSLPSIVEAVASYSGQEPAAVYRAVVAAVDACPSFSVTFGGSPLAVPLRSMSIPPVGLASSAWSATVPYSGSTIEFRLGVVLDGHSVVALMWFDSVPPAAAIMGGFTSTLSAALGKLA